MRRVVILTGSEGIKQIDKILSEEFDKEFNREEDPQNKLLVEMNKRVSQQELLSELDSEEALNKIETPNRGEYPVGGVCVKYPGGEYCESNFGQEGLPLDTDFSPESKLKQKLQKESLEVLNKIRELDSDIKESKDREHTHLLRLSKDIMEEYLDTLRERLKLLEE